MGNSKNTEKEKLLQTDREFAQRSLEIGVAEAFHEYLDPEALMLSANQHPTKGRDTIYQQMLLSDNYTLSWEPQDGNVAGSGDLGYTWGQYKAISKNSVGSENIRYGKYLNIWKKQADGNWKVLVDMGNANPKE